MDSPQADPPRKGIRLRAIEAGNQTDFAAARKMAREILDDPEVTRLTIGMRASLERILTPIFGDRPTGPVERVIVSLPQKNRVQPKSQPERELAPPTRSLIKGSPVMGGHFRFPVNAMAHRGTRGK